MFEYLKQAFPGNTDDDAGDYVSDSNDSSDSWRRDLQPVCLCFPMHCALLAFSISLKKC